MDESHTPYERCRSEASRFGKSVYRKEKEIAVGAKVLLRDPRLRKAGGRAWYKQPSTPGVITEKHGNKCTVKKDDGSFVREVHAEDILLVPESTRDLEDPKEPLTFDEDNAVLDIDRRRSPGEMIEDEGKAV